MLKHILPWLVAFSLVSSACSGVYSAGAVGLDKTGRSGSAQRNPGAIGIATRNCQSNAGAHPAGEFLHTHGPPTGADPGSANAYRYAVPSGVSLLAAGRLSAGKVVQNCL